MKKGFSLKYCCFEVLNPPPVWHLWDVEGLFHSIKPCVINMFGKTECKNANAISGNWSVSDMPDHQPSFYWMPLSAKVSTEGTGASWKTYVWLTCGGGKKSIFWGFKSRNPCERRIIRKGGKSTVTGNSLVSSEAALWGWTADLTDCFADLRWPQLLSWLKARRWSWPSSAEPGWASQVKKKKNSTTTVCENLFMRGAYKGLADMSVECVTYTWRIFHMSIRYTACGQCLEKGGPL